MVLCYILIKASRICLAVFHRLETDISICYQTTVAGQFAERHFAERHFAERHFAELFRQVSFSIISGYPNHIADIAFCQLELTAGLTSIQGRRQPRTQAL